MADVAAQQSSRGPRSSGLQPGSSKPGCPARLPGLCCTEGDAERGTPVVSRCLFALLPMPSSVCVHAPLERTNLAVLPQVADPDVCCGSGVCNPLYLHASTLFIQLHLLQGFLGMSLNSYVVWSSLLEGIVPSLYKREEFVQM